MRIYDDIPIKKCWCDDTSEPITLDDPDVKGLSYHQAMGEGDRHYVDVILNNGRVQRIFVIHAIEFLEASTEEINGN